MFGKIIGTIGLTFAPIDFEFAMSNSNTDPIKRMSMALDCFCLTVLVAMPLAVMLLVAPLLSVYNDSDSEGTNIGVARVGTLFLFFCTVDDRILFLATVLLTTETTLAPRRFAIQAIPCGCALFVLTCCQFNRCFPAWWGPYSCCIPC